MMRLRAFFILLFPFVVSYSQVKKNTIPAKEVNDFMFSLHEETVNKVLTAIGPVHGTSDYELMLVSGKYDWTISNARINIRPDSSDFLCDALVKVSMFEYKTKVVGNVKITYDNDSNKIYIKISRAIFELYTVMFGKKFHIKNIHLEEHFKDPFAFEGPRTLAATEMEFTMPDSTRKKIYVAPTECRMQLKFKEICTSCEVAACEVHAPPPIKLMPPIEATRPGTYQIAPTGTLSSQKK
jgi:hypothetical protein